MLPNKLQETIHPPTARPKQLQITDPSSAQQLRYVLCGNSLPTSPHPCPRPLADYWIFLGTVRKMLCFYSAGCARSCLGYCPWYLSLDTKARPTVFVPVCSFPTGKGAHCQITDPFRALSRKDNRLSGRMRAMNMNGLQELLWSRQSTSTHRDTHSPHIARTLLPPPAQWLKSSLH